MLFGLKIYVPKINLTILRSEPIFGKKIYVNVNNLLSSKRPNDAKYLYSLLLENPLISIHVFSNKL